jgi:hypothetical protein
MRVLGMLPMTFLLLTLAACGGGKPTAVPIASAGVLPVFATTAPTVTASAPTTVQSIGASTSPARPAIATPTPLASSGTPTAAGARAASTVRATPVPGSATPNAAQPTATAQTPQVARVTDVPTSAPQQTIGTAADGLTLLNVRSANHDGYTRLVFDLSKPDGSAAPVPRTRLWTQGGTVIVAFGGVRDDVFATSLGGGEQQLNLGMVKAVYRIPARDDEAAAYGIAVSGGTRVTLSSTTQPTRVIVDIADK